MIPKRKGSLFAVLLMLSVSVGVVLHLRINRSERYEMLRHFSEMPYFLSARRVARIVKPGQMREITLSPRYGGGGFELKGRSYVLHAPKTPKGNPKILWGIQYFVEGEPTGPIEHFANWAPERFSSLLVGSRYWLLDVAIEENRFADERVDDSIVYFRSMTLNDPISNSLQSHYRVRPPPVSTAVSNHVIYRVSGTGSLLPTDINIDEDTPVLVRFNGFGDNLTDRSPLAIASRVPSAYVVFVRLCFDLPEDWMPRRNRF